MKLDEIKKWRKIFATFIRHKDADKKHAKFSPSGLHRVKECLASANFCKDLPSEDNKYGIRGTHTHTLIEFLLKHGIDGLMALKHPAADEFLDHIGFDDGMMECARTMMYFVRDERARMKKASGVEPTVLIEAKSRCDEIVNDDCGGTADFVIFNLFGVLHVADYKNGTKFVDEVENDQMMTYALGILHKYGWDFKEVWLTVVQPNGKTTKPPIRTWKTTIERLQKYERELKTLVKKANDPKAPFSVGDHCYFCVGRHTCPPKNAINTEKLLSRFERPAINNEGKTHGKKESKEKTKIKTGKKETLKAAQAVRR